MGATPGIRPFLGKDLRRNLGAVKQNQFNFQPPIAALTTIILSKEALANQRLIYLASLQLLAQAWSSRGIIPK